MSATTIAVIGAGFSGTLLSLHLLRRCPRTTRVMLIEQGGQFGRGQAYSTGNASHLLNVPAARMSAFHDRPDSFLDWLGGLPEAARDGVEPVAEAFVPRRLYGAYIRDLLKEEIRREPRSRLQLVRGEVTGVDRGGPALRLLLDRGRELAANLAVLAVGNFPPAPAPVADPSFYDTPLYRPDPWAPGTLADLDPASPVLLIGTGLTMVDVVISLLDQGHAGPIHALSRRGLLPRRHGGGKLPDGDDVPELPNRLGDLLRFLRGETRRAAAAGGSWQPVVDGLRPFTQDVWQTMPQEDRVRFLRHLRPWWEVHRHRMAGPVADRIEAAQANGQMQVRAGRIRGYERTTDGMVEVAFRPRGGERLGDERLATLRVARVVNCSGPGADYDRIAHPLVRSLLRDGTARPDALRLGLDVTSTCALLNREGGISRRLFAVGPVTKGTFWEMTAVPDIRRQCELLAQHLATLAKPGPAPAPRSIAPVPTADAEDFVI
ncbi:MAG: FAD/NAD(P)-binding protein [Acetobacteraceae bacterium]|nr:FAD/NAD(P)-binding protein [Acetobacteraceae bacterium]